MHVWLGRWAAVGLGAVCAVMLALSPVFAAPKKDFKVAWILFAGYMPLGYAAESGIMKRWADKYGITVDLVQQKDYVDAINQYTAGAFDGCAMVQMDALTIPAAGGVDSTALFIIDFSNGTDGIVLKNGQSVAAIKGRKVNLVEFSVSHYLLARALDEIKMPLSDITVVNTSDAEIVAAFASPEATAAVAWNPQLAEIGKMEGVTTVYNSSEIPGEIIDVMVVNTETLADNPAFGKALTGAWYEIMDLMAAGDKTALEAMAKASGTDLAGYKAQLQTTKLFRATEAIPFAETDWLPKTMDLVRTFAFEQKLLGEGAKTQDAVGMTFPNGETLGDPDNVKLRFNAEFMRMAAEGKL